MLINYALLSCPASFFPLVANNVKFTILTIFKYTFLHVYIWSDIEYMVMLNFFFGNIKMSPNIKKNLIT